MGREERDRRRSVGPGARLRWRGSWDPSRGVLWPWGVLWDWRSCGMFCGIGSLVRSLVGLNWKSCGVGRTVLGKRLWKGGPTLEKMRAPECSLFGRAVARTTQPSERVYVRSNISKKFWGGRSPYFYLRTLSAVLLLSTVPIQTRRRSDPKKKTPNTPH